MLPRAMIENLPTGLLRRVVLPVLLSAALAHGPAGCAAPTAAAGDSSERGAGRDPQFGFLMRYEWHGDIDEAGLAEPSGIVHHGGRDTLFAVGDEGGILEMRRDGEALQHETLAEGADLEGIACDPATGLLYVAVEGEEAILEVEPDALRIRRRFELPRRYRGRTVMARGGEGIEAIAFVPDSQHPDGGTFFVANQAFTLDDPTDTSALIELELPIGNAGGPGGGGAGAGAGGGEDGAVEPRILAYYPIEVIDLAGLHYDRRIDRFFVVCDSPNVLLRVTRRGRVERGWALPGREQEGLAILGRDQLYIAQDVGGILHIRWRNR